MHTDKETNKNKNNLPGYPHHPDNEDIYQKVENVSDMNNEYQSLTMLSNNIPDTVASDEDVPGSELDDEQEQIGSEDEENNYYSLGGDEHNNLEENQGE